MPDDPNIPEQKNHFRFSIGGVMAAVFVLACGFASFRMVTVSTYESAVLLQTFDPSPALTPKGKQVGDLVLSPAILEDAASRLKKPLERDLTTGLVLDRYPPNMFTVHRATGDPEEDAQAVKAVAEALVDSCSPGTLRIKVQYRVGLDFGLIAGGLVGIVAALLALVAVLLTRRMFRAIADRLLHFQSPIMFDAGASYDPQR